eukprot:Clim_evm42s172 gene=Clim_evmTU42s172
MSEFDGGFPRIRIVPSLYDFVLQHLVEDIWLMSTEGIGSIPQPAFLDVVRRIRSNAIAPHGETDMTRLICLWYHQQPRELQENAKDDIMGEICIGLSHSLIAAKWMVWAGMNKSLIEYGIGSDQGECRRCIRDDQVMLSSCTACIGSEAKEPFLGIWDPERNRHCMVNGSTLCLSLHATTRHTQRRLYHCDVSRSVVIDIDDSPRLPTGYFTVTSAMTVNVLRVRNIPSLSGRFLNKLFHRTNLTELVLENLGDGGAFDLQSNPWTWYYFFRMEEICGQLKRLTLRNLPWLRNAHILGNVTNPYSLMTPMRCKNLTHLEISKCPQLMDPTMSAFLDAAQHSLVSVNYDDSGPGVTNALMFRFLEMASTWSSTACLRYLSVRNCQHITDISQASTETPGPYRLRSLRLDGSGVSLAGALALAIHCPSLQALGISGLKNWRAFEGSATRESNTMDKNQDAYTFIANVYKLHEGISSKTPFTEFFAGDHWQIGGHNARDVQQEVAMRYIARHLLSSHVSKLNLGGGWTDAVVAELSKRVPTDGSAALVAIHIGLANRLSDSGFLMATQLLTRNTLPASLTARFSNVSQATLVRSLGYLSKHSRAPLGTKLTCLCVTEHTTKLDDRFLRAIGRHCRGRLAELRLGGANVRFTDEGLRYLRPLRDTLRVLDLSFTGGYALQGLTLHDIGFGMLRELRLDGCLGVGSDPSKLMSGWLGDTALAVRMLSLAGCESLDDRTLAKLVPLARIQTLVLDGTAVTDEGVVNFLVQHVETIYHVSINACPNIEHPDEILKAVPGPGDRKRITVEYKKGKWRKMPELKLQSP